MSPLEHLQQSDPIMAGVIEKVGPLDDRPDTDNHFIALARIIVGQQLSTTVARAIWNRIETHFGDILTPSAVLQTEIETLRTLGLSGAKASYIQSLAAHINEGKLQADKLESLSDEDIAREVVAVKGLGPWSVDMFLMFHLKRPDILAVGDLGIREAMRRLYDLPTRPMPTEMEKIAAPWSPHRTLACRYLWRSLD